MLAGGVVRSRVRRATSADILPIVDMIEALRASVCGPVAVDRAHTAATLAGLLSAPDGAVWVSPGGFIAGVLTRTIISPVPFAQELGWFATDGSGLRLLRVFEAWAQERGAALIQLSTGPSGPDLTRLGYRRAEQAWVRSI